MYPVHSPHLHSHHPAWAVGPEHAHPLFWLDASRKQATGQMPDLLRNLGILQEVEVPCIAVCLDHA
jgi:hypothetical protein